LRISEIPSHVKKQEVWPAILTNVTGDAGHDWCFARHKIWGSISFSLIHSPQKFACITLHPNISQNHATIPYQLLNVDKPISQASNPSTNPCPVYFKSHRRVPRIRNVLSVKYYSILFLKCKGLVMGDAWFFH